MVDVRELTVTYEKSGKSGAPEAVRGLSFHVERGSVTTLIGPNGCGKSTVLRAIAGLLRPKTGRVLLDGTDRRRLSGKEAARLMAFLPQTLSAPADCTVETIVSYGRTPYLRFGRGMTAADTGAVREAIGALNLSGMEHRTVSTLSGGERQRVWLAMCLAQQPKLLLLDEPTTYLDIAGQYETLRLIQRLGRERGLTILMVLHDLNQAARFSDRILAMRDGMLAGQGTVREMITPEMIGRVFSTRGIVAEDPVTGTPMFLPEK